MTKMTNSTVKSKFSPLKQLNFSVLGEGFPIGLLWPLSRTETDHEIENRDHHMIFLLLMLFQYILMENYTRKNIKFSFFAFKSPYSTLLWLCWLFSTLWNAFCLTKKYSFYFFYHSKFYVFITFPLKIVRRLVGSFF